MGEMGWLPFRVQVLLQGAVENQPKGLILAHSFRGIDPWSVGL